MGAAPADCLLRPYQPEDCAVLAILFHETVHTINAKDYSPAQLDAWSTGSVDLDTWNRSFLAHDTWVAWIGDKIVGFADMDASGYLDRLYVHRDYQHHGIATALCDHLEQRAAAKTFVTHASITAKPFFLARGYAVVRAQVVQRHGVELQNFVMEKRRILPR
jgi:putative acetyltransferase